MEGVSRRPLPTSPGPALGSVPCSEIAHDARRDELQQTRRQFWMPALAAGFVIFGLPVLYVVEFAIYAALSGTGLEYD